MMKMIKTMMKMKIKIKMKGGPFGLLDFELCALWALRPCDPWNSWIEC